MFPSKQFSITVIQVYTPTYNAEEAEVEWFHEDLPNLLELTPKKRCPFHHKGLKCIIGSLVIPRVTGKFGLGVQNKTGQRLTEFGQENAWVIEHGLPTNLHMDIIRWSILKSN